MDLAVLKPTELAIGLAALRTVALANGSVTAPERLLLEVIARLHGTEVDVDALPTVSPDQVAEAITEAHTRKRLVQLAVVTAMVDGEVTRSQEDAVRALALALEVDESALTVLHDVAGKHLLLTRIDMARRIMGRFLGEAYDEEGLGGVRKMFSILTRDEDPDTAWKYRQLGLLPEGTLGRVFWEHCTRRRFAMPGDKGGIPERMVFHDFGHVLAGYDTEPEGEIQQGAFQAGFVRNDGFAFLLFVVIQFHLGMKVTPIAEGQVGLFDAAKVLHAVERGAACKVDLSDHWNHWEWVGLPLEEARRRLGIVVAEA